MGAIDSTLNHKELCFAPCIVCRQYTVNKGLAISCPQPGCYLPKSPWSGIIYPIPVPRRFGQKIPGIRNFFLQCTHFSPGDGCGLMNNFKDLNFQTFGRDISKISSETNM